MVHPLRRWRAANDVTLAALAKKTGVTASHLSELERGLDRPSLDVAQKLSAATVDATGSPAVLLQEIADAAPPKNGAAAA